LNSLLEDLIGFARENIEKAGVSFAESNQRDRQLIDAYKGGGQVNPEQRQAMAEEYINQASPMSAVGGMIKPQNWAKFAPEAKASLTDVANRFPEKFKQVLRHPDELEYTVGHTDLPPNIGGQFHQRGSPGAENTAKIKIAEGYESGPYRVPEHELNHYLERQRVLNTTNADDAMTIGRLLQSRLPADQRGSLDKAILKATDEPSPLFENITSFKDLVARGKELGLAKRDPFNISADDQMLRNWDARPIKKDVDGITNIVNSYVAMDEGLAHLAQAAARADATPEIKKLASELGVNFADTPKDVMDEFINRAVSGGGNTWDKIRRLFGNRPKNSEIRPGYARESLSEAEQKLYNKLDKRALEGIRPNIPRETTKPGTLEFWQLLRENPSAAKRFFRKELLDRWDAIQQAKAGGRRKIERGG
jgi:hypothetical protein